MLEATSDVRLAIAARLEGEADWRSEKASEYPEDDRNQRAAAAMRRTAAYVRNLSIVDPRLRYLDSVHMDGMDAFHASGDWMERAFGPFEGHSSEWEDFVTDEYAMWSRIGFDDGGQRDADAYIAEIVAFYSSPDSSMVLEQPAS